MMNEKKVKSSLLKLLKQKGTYQKETDDQLIDAYVFNMKMQEDAIADIKARGVMVQIGKDKDFAQKNFSVNTYHDCQRLMNEIIKKLGLEKKKVVENEKGKAKNNLMKLISN